MRWSRHISNVQARASTPPDTAAPLFGRKEAKRRSEQYVRGLLVQQTDRLNAEHQPGCTGRCVDCARGARCPDPDIAFRRVNIGTHW